METHKTALTYSFRPVHWALALCVLLIWVLIQSAPVRYTMGDSRYALLASQSLLEQGTLQLDDYMYRYDLTEQNQGKNWMVFRQGTEGHFYYDYPVGTSLLSLPFVALGRMMGMNMVVYDDDAQMQMWIASIVCILIFLLLFRLARLYLDDWPALAFALLIFAGSSLISTLGTALWSQDFQVLCMLMALVELAEAHTGKRESPRGVRTGIWLFLAYLCRPTSVALIVPVLVWLAVQYRSAFYRAALSSGVLFLLFLLWSYLEFGTWLPQYYDPGSWESNARPFEDLWPLWMGPARGFFVFTPVLLLSFLGLGFRNVRRQGPFLMVLSWWLILSYILIHSQAPWGGWCYGPRFFTGIVPGFAWLLLILSQDASFKISRIAPYTLGAFLLFASFGLFVHTYQGLYNEHTIGWNDRPNIDGHWRSRRLDWNDPQFLATKVRNDRREKRFNLEHALRIRLAQLPDDVAVLYGQADPDFDLLFRKWNRKDQFRHGQRLYNSVYALAQAGEKEVWLPLDMKDYFDARGSFVWSEAPHPGMSLGDFLNMHPDKEIILSVRDEGSFQLSEISRAWLRDRGSRIDDLKLRESYIAVIRNGKLVHEEMGPGRLEYHSDVPRKLFVRSEGLLSGNESIINVEGWAYSLNMRGINVAVLDQDRNLVYATGFDTHLRDAELRHWIHARLK